MSVRLIQNNFVSGELSPALYGRHDLKQYFQGAASIENFIVRSTGGLVKRPGTNLVASASVGTAARFRLVTMLHTRDEYTMILLYRKPGDNTLYYRVTREGEAFGGERSTDAAQLLNDDVLDLMKVKQIGDSLFFSMAGMRSFYAKVDYRSNPVAVAWKQIDDGTSVEDAPPFSKDSPVVRGFKKDTSQGFVKSNRRYALWGVKDGVLSKPTYLDAEIWLYWVSGATVTLKFTPDFAKHDYYVLGLLRGAQYGAVAYFYPATEVGAPTDTTWEHSSDASCLASWTRPPVEPGGKEEIWTPAGGTDVNTALTAPFPNDTDENGRSSHALLVNGVLDGTYNHGAAPVLSIRVWFGGYMDASEDGASSVRLFPYNGQAKVSLQREDGTAIQSWVVTPAFSNNPQTLYVDEPMATADGRYKVSITSLAEGVPVCVRGIVLVTDSAPRTYVDDNIDPGTVTGQQDLMAVGDNGMDAGIIDSWEQRLVMASSVNRPFTMWFSQTGDIYNFYRNRPQVPGDAFDATLPATRASRILHILTSRWMVLFTEAGEYLVDSSGGSGFSLNTITIKKSSGVGAHETIEPVATEDKILFAAADARSVYELRYDLSQDNVIPVNRSILSGHLTEAHKIVKIAYQRFPESVLWCLLDDGQLISMTYLPDQDVFAWSHHRFAESDGMRLVDINIPGTTTEPPYGETMSDVLLTWESDNHPGSVYIEAMRNTVSTDSPPGADARCVDHAGYQTDISVPVEARFVTMRPESPQLNTMALYKSVRDCTLRVRRSGLLEIRPYVDRAPMDHAQNGPLAYASSVWQKNKSPLVDGDVVHLVNGDVSILPRTISNGDGQIEVRSADEYPCEIQSILYNIDIATRPE